MQTVAAPTPALGGFMLLLDDPLLAEVLSYLAVCEAYRPLRACPRLAGLAARLEAGWWRSRPWAGHLLEAAGSQPRPPGFLAAALPRLRDWVLAPSSCGAWAPAPSPAQEDLRSLHREVPGMEVSLRVADLQAQLPGGLACAMAEASLAAARFSCPAAESEAVARLVASMPTAMLWDHCRYEQWREHMIVRGIRDGINREDIFSAGVAVQTPSGRLQLAVKARTFCYSGERGNRKDSSVQCEATLPGSQDRLLLFRFDSSDDSEMPGVDDSLQTPSVHLLDGASAALLGSSGPGLHAVTLEVLWRMLCAPVALWPSGLEPKFGSVCEDPGKPDLGGFLRLREVFEMAAQRFLRLRHQPPVSSISPLDWCQMQTSMAYDLLGPYPGSSAEEAGRG